MRSTAKTAATSPTRMEGTKMANNSVNTNVGAMVALQNLNATNMELSQVQTRINTGKKVSSAKENGLILHTSVTIGYDAPWRQVHQLLIAFRRPPGRLRKCVGYRPGLCVCDRWRSRRRHRDHVQGRMRN